MLRTLLAPRLVAALLFLLLLGVLQSGAAPLTPATQMPLVHLSPALIVVPVGETACVDLQVQDVQDLFGFSTDIAFDPSRLAVVDADAGDAGIQIAVGPFLQPATPGNWYVINSADNARGLIRFAVTLFPPETGHSGSGTLATICFRGLNRGHSAITLSESGTLLVDSQVSTIPSAMKSGGAFVGSVFRFHIPLVVRGR